jgi:uncharacterized membrane protein YfcA
MAVIAAVAMTLPSASETALLVAAAFGTAMVSAVAGFGGGVLLLVACIGVLGPRNAVVVVTIAQLASTGGRMWFNRTEISRRLVGVFSLGAVPGAVAGALLLTATAPHTHARMIGGFLLALVLWRHFHRAAVHLPDPVFAVIGAAAGVGSGLLGSVGPLVAQFFLARGLVRGAFIGTNASVYFILHVVKLVIYGQTAVLTYATALIGLLLVPASVAGSWAGKQIVDRVPAGAFVNMVDFVVVASGVALLIGGSP